MRRILDLFSKRMASGCPYDDKDDRIEGERYYEDKLPGGLADTRKPSDFNPEALVMGIKIELEHTKDAKIAQEIAMDHLTEDPEYYIKLKDVEKKD